jgi:hypothetical protein
MLKLFWELAGTEKKSSNTAFKQVDNVGCTFPGPQNATFVQLLFYKPIYPRKKKEALPLLKISVTLILFFTFLFFNQSRIFGQDIQLSETIKVDRAANLQVTPRTFCVTEDKLFLLPYQDGTIKVFAKSGNFLKFVKALNPRFDGESLVHPTYCSYSRDEGKFGVIDYALKKVFIFDRSWKTEFTPIKKFPCKRLGYDMEFTRDGEQLVISGYVTDKDKMPFDLYSINIRTGQISYLLPSHQKYNRKDVKDYVIEYYKKQTLPVIGIKAFIDIQGDDLFFVWEGALRIIKLNLRSGETMDFGHDSPYYTKPDGSKLSYSYLRGDFETTWKEQKKMAYVRNIFATPRHVFLVYETGKSNKSNVSTFRLQKYSPNGNYLADVLIPGNPSSQMWFDKESYELYSFSKQSENDNGKFTILKYKIKR